jgi:putative ABC transport system substrate-binding protein
MNNKLKVLRLAASLWLAWLPLAALAQTLPKVAHIGILSLPPSADGVVARAVAKALQDLGYVDGKNAVLEFRYADWQSERLSKLASDLEKQKVDVIVAILNVPGFAAKAATEHVPIVVWAIHGAVETGLVDSLARPGGRITGVETLAPAVDAKRMELIKQILPRLARLGVIYNADDRGASVHLTSLRDVSRILGIEVVTLPVRRPEDFDSALSGAAATSVDGLLTMTDELTANNWGKVAEFAFKRRLPTVCEFRVLIQSGCLVSYGPPLQEITTRAVQQVDKILKGTKAGDLPVEQVTRFETLINMKTAKAIGVAIPQLVLLRADEVIE